MKTVSSRDLIRHVAERWKAQYCHPDGAWSKTLHGDTGDVYRRLAALDVEAATPSEVASIIGNESWCRLTCNECGEYVDLVIQVGQEPDYDSATANLCKGCLSKAVDLMHGVTRLEVSAVANRGDE